MGIFLISVLIYVDRPQLWCYKDDIIKYVRKTMKMKINTNEKIILTDCDGVMLDWVTAFDAWMASNGYTKSDADVYDMSQVYGITRDECTTIIKQFNSSAWMGYLTAFRDSRSGVAKLVENGYKFVVITSLSLDRKARLLRIDNIKNVFGEDVVEEVICLDTGADKDDALTYYTQKYPNAEYWLEDKFENAECGLQFGLKCLLLKHGHNEDRVNDQLIKVDTWSDITDLILGEK